ncbi:MAG: carbamoyl-phosphate synthase large subunit, partial [Acidobacteriota bacterium]
MKSVGEVMALGGTFREALMKGLAALELDGSEERRRRQFEDPVRLRSYLSIPNWQRLFAVLEALRGGWQVDEIHRISHIDRWFLRELESLIDLEKQLHHQNLESASRALLFAAKEAGLSSALIARLLGTDAGALEARLEALDIRRVYKRVDTCAAEFPAMTPYLYSTYGEEDEAEPSERRKVIVLGSGPNRIGQGIEFDYCCVHAVLELRERGVETIMVNCNPETVSTDYDTSDRLYFEPLTLEHVLAVVRREQPDGVIVQLGGQTPLKLARGLEAAGVPIWGTPQDTIDLAEDRERFGKLLAEENILQPLGSIATSVDEALEAASTIGFPVVVRPSYVLGGRAMAVVYDESTLRRYMDEAADVSEGAPVLLDHFLEDAFEVDLDLLCDGETAVVCGIMQHIEEAGIHSGDSAAMLPPYRVGPFDLDQMREIGKRLALRLGVVGLMNVQFAIYEGGIYVIEVNPRASRTVPFIAKAVGVPLVRLAARVMAGEKLKDLGFTSEPKIPGVFVKMPVFPFRRFPGVDPVLGPEMKSTGEVMGADDSFGAAFAKAWIGAGHKLPAGGRAFVSVHDRDKRALIAVAKRLVRQGFSLLATQGTADFLEKSGIAVERVAKVHEGHPNVVDVMINQGIDLVVNTPWGRESHVDDAVIRTTALRYDIPCITTLSGAMAAVEGIAALERGDLQVRSLQDYERS